MAELKKFAFDNFVIKSEKKKPVVAPQVEEVIEEEIVDEVDFEDAPLAEEVQELPVKTYFQEELDERVRQATEEGYERGYREAQSGCDAKVVTIMNEINDKLKIIFSDNNKFTSELENQFLEMSKAIVQKLLPSLADEHAVEIVNKFIADNFNSFKKEAKLSFYIHPDTISYVQENIAKLADINDFEGKISLHKDSSLGLSDCRVEWENGGVEHNTAGLVNAIETLVDDNRTDKTERT